jgi:predicted O-linked N-acetylglucosamine transferase (SPINDLY family)
MSAHDYDEAAKAVAAGRLEDAARGFAVQLARDPAHLPSLVDSGVLSFAMGKPEQAVELFERALRQIPDNLAVATNLGRALAAAGRYVAGEGQWRRILAHVPGDANARYELGKALLAQARHDEALAEFQAALAQIDGPLRQQCWRGCINMLNYLDAVSPERVRDENRRFAAAHTPAALPLPFANTREPQRRLRVGYVTSDFYSHSVARSMLGLFAHRDRARIESFVYAEIERPDAVTKAFREMSDNWVSTVGADDAAVAARIRADAIDVLVLIAGHFDKNRIGVLLQRAAPVQLSIGDVGPHGTTAIDGATFDPTMLAGRGDLFDERVLRLRWNYVHAPIFDAPDVAVPPVLRNAYVTFGSANNPAKMSPRTFDLWAAALHAVPNARLKLKFMRAFGEPAMRALFVARFVARGVDAARIEFADAALAHDAHLRFYADIDIALDTYPFTGSTTTFEALWMGVPVVTLTGSTVLQRWTTAMLTRAGLEHMCAGDDAAFARIASDLAQRAPTQDRASIRACVGNSALCDLPGQARAYERLYRAMWRRWCAANAL